MGNSANAKSGSGTLGWRILRAGCVISSLMMTAIPALAQSPSGENSQSHRARNGTMLGVEVTVVDPTGAVIRKANVTLSPLWHRHSCLCETVPLAESPHRQEYLCHTAQDGNAPGIIAVRTDSRGVAHLRGSSKGSYEIVVEAPGFATVQQTEPGEKLQHLRVKLQIAVKPYTLEVRATPGVVDTIATFSGEPLPYVPYLPIQFPVSPVHLAVI